MSDSTHMRQRKRHGDVAELHSATAECHYCECCTVYACLLMRCVCSFRFSEGIEALQAANGFLERLPEEAQAEWWRARLFLLQLILHKRDVEEHERLRARVIAAADRRQDLEVREMAQTAAQAYEARGRIEGRHEMLLHQMRIKFGALPDAVVAKIEAIQTAARLDRLSEQILIAQSIEEMGL